MSSEEDGQQKTSIHKGVIMTLTRLLKGYKRTISNTNIAMFGIKSSLDIKSTLPIDD